MKKILLLTAILLIICVAAVLLTTYFSTRSGVENDRSVTVVIEEGSGFSVENNALHVQPGEDAVFLLKLERGITLLSADYRGEYEISEKDGLTELTLRQVRFPTRLRLSLSAKSGQIRYWANGGTSPDGSESIVKSYSLTIHPRANTMIGIDTFSRDGYTLVSWNTESDGSGERIGLGSRVTLTGGELNLYAQWAPWSAEEDFLYVKTDNGCSITDYRGQDTTVVIPAEIAGMPVRSICAGAFQNCASSSVILPPGLETIEEGAFVNCSMTELTLFDDIVTVSDGCFVNCNTLKTLHINAREAPYGYVFRKESVYADKVDLLILSQGRKKLVFYGGCSMWYNLDGIQADKLFGDEYTIINLALNGTVCSAVQMQIMAAYLEQGDILFHTPELSSRTQLMLITEMREYDSSLWCGIENNYDLFALVDLRTVNGVFDSLCHYLSMKDRRCDYNQFFSKDYNTPYIDQYGCIPFYRSEHSDKLADRVSINIELLDEKSLDVLREYYAKLQSLGVRIYVSYACINLDALPDGQADTIALANDTFRRTVSDMDGVKPVSQLEDFLFHNEDFYDTNYHLLSEPAKKNTAVWMRDLHAQMVQDGLLEVGS